MVLYSQKNKHSPVITIIGKKSRIISVFDYIFDNPDSFNIEYQEFILNIYVLILLNCVATITKFMHKSKDPAFPKLLAHYTEDDDHNRSEDAEDKITRVPNDAAQQITAFGSRYEESSEYQLLIRIIEEYLQL